MKANLWFLTEERPKKEVLHKILERFIKDKRFSAFINPLIIKPIIENGRFTFIYEVIGLACNKVDKVIIKTTSGYSSFVDYMIFYQKHEPQQTDIPLYLIEETKTDDEESRNTGVYQRSSKFIYAHFFYPNVSKIMLYNLRIEQKEKATETYIFGTKMLKTLGVEIVGKKGLDDTVYDPFTSVDEFIEHKNNMSPPKSGQRVIIIKNEQSIEITAKLLNQGKLAHDPNIGMTTIMAQVLRNLGWEKAIIIKEHHLTDQKQVGKTNKFIQIANQLNISLLNLDIPKVFLHKNYWYYDFKSEKLGTIFIQLVVEHFSKGEGIFENHAGSEKSYFITEKGEAITLSKYVKIEGKKHKINIPDLILLDVINLEIINIEGKIYQNRQKGIKELQNYDLIDKYYINKHYPTFKIIRTVVLYGSQEEEIIEVEVGFLLNENGQLILGIKAPQLFKEAIKNLLDFWK